MAIIAVHSEPEEGKRLSEVKFPCIRVLVRVFSLIIRNLFFNLFLKRISNYLIKIVDLKILD